MIQDPHVVHVNELSFTREVSDSSLPVLIDISTEWCPPCRVAASVILELAHRHLGRLKVVAIDGDESPQLAAQLGVRGFPTFLGVVRGEVVLRRAGFGGKGALSALADALLASAGG
jgi:thioredoxin 1